ncbi:hypothetical protein BGZ57DRAFT_975038 [Hyaloscypha finlandica]|nr:hypothetical protein BGZ57DRAFT_975038 [Hyaloscypha finlandica]
MRTAPLDVDEEETVTGVYFPMRQRIVIYKIREMLKTNCLDNEYTDEGERDQELTEALMHFCWMVLLQNMERETVYRSPLMYFLAVIGVDSAAETLRHSFVYTPYLAGVLWVNRLLMLEYALPLRVWPVTKLVARADVTSVRARVKESNIYWSEDFQTLFFKGRPIEIRKLQDFGSAVVAEARAALQQLTFGTDLPVVNLGKVTDTMSWSSELRKSAYSFVTDKRFGLDVGFQFLLQRARQAPKDLRLLKKTADGKECWNDRAVHSYLANEERFLRKLMVAMHVISLPGRGSEISSIKFANSIYSARNIYVLNRRMAFVTCYDKSRSRRMTTEYVMRYWPDELSQVLAQYLAFAGEQLSAALAEATAMHLGVRLPVSEWRHTAIAIGDRFLHKGIKAFRDQGVSGMGAKDDDDEDSSQEDEEEITTMAEVQVR